MRDEEPRRQPAVNDDYRTTSVNRLRETGATFGPEQETCPRCSHLFAPHIAAALTGDPRQGGVLLCQVKGCRCFGTWSIPQLGSTKETVPLPDSIDEFEWLMEQVQTEEPTV